MRKEIYKSGMAINMANELLITTKLGLLLKIVAIIANKIATNKDGRRPSKDIKIIVLIFSLYITQELINSSLTGNKGIIFSFFSVSIKFIYY